MFAWCDFDPGFFFGEIPFTRTAAKHALYAFVKEVSTWTRYPHQNPVSFSELGLIHPGRLQFINRPLRKGRSTWAKLRPVLWMKGNWQGRLGAFKFGPQYAPNVAKIAGTVPIPKGKIESRQVAADVPTLKDELAALKIL